MKHFIIKESDLADLEHTLPELLMAMYPLLGGGAETGANRLRLQWSRVQEIVKNVRWNYGPPEEVTVIPCDGESNEPVG